MIEQAAGVISTGLDRERVNASFILNAFLLTSCCTAAGVVRTYSRLRKLAAIARSIVSFVPSVYTGTGSAGPDVIVGLCDACQNVRAFSGALVSTPMPNRGLGVSRMISCKMSGAAAVVDSFPVGSRVWVLNVGRKLHACRDPTAG